MRSLISLPLGDIVENWRVGLLLVASLFFLMVGEEFVFEVGRASRMLFDGADAVIVSRGIAGIVNGGFVGVPLVDGGVEGELAALVRPPSTGVAGVGDCGRVGDMGVGVDEDVVEVALDVIVALPTQALSSSLSPRISSGVPVTMNFMPLLGV